MLDKLLNLGSEWRFIRLREIHHPHTNKAVLN